MPIVQALAAIFSLAILPFLKEWLIGLKDHPFNEQRDKKGIINLRTIAIVLFIICCNLGLLYVDATITNSKLTKQLEHQIIVAATTKDSDHFKTTATIKYDLLECNKRIDAEAERSVLLVKKVALLATTNQDLNTRIEQCSLPTPVPTPQRTDRLNPDLADVRDRIKRLKQQ